MSDIGICDDCGAEYEDSVMVPRVITVDGVPYNAFVWLCESCGKAARDDG